jgi:thiol-disulfide isomerase/thioredoxin
LQNAHDGDVVLFFKADWCPTCIALDKSIIDQSNDIPEHVTILEIDYDNATELRKKYGVTTQHTLVQVDENGEMIAKWTGGADLDALVTKIQ